MDSSDAGLLGLYVAANFVAPPLIHEAARRLKAGGYGGLADGLDAWAVPLLDVAFFYRSIRQQRHITERRVVRALAMDEKARAQTTQQGGPSRAASPPPTVSSARRAPRR